MELVQMLGYRVWIHFNVWETLGVSLEVDLEVSFGREPVPAYVALERPLTRVRPNMDL